MGKKCCLNAQELMRGKRLGPQYCKHLIVCDNVAEARTTAIVGVNCVARQGPKSHGLRPARRGEARARETERAAVDVAGGVLVWPSWCGGGVKAFIKHGGQQRLRHGEHRATKVTIMGTHNTRDKTQHQQHHGIIITRRRRPNDETSTFVLPSTTTPLQQQHHHHRQRLHTTSK